MATQTLSTEDILEGIEQSTYEIDTESRLARVGLKDDQDIASILERYAWLYSLESVGRMREAYEREPDPAEKERLRRVLYYVLDGYVERATAVQEDELVSREMAAVVRLDGEEIPYHNVRALMAREPDYDRRDRLRDASLAVVEELNPLRAEMLRTRLSVLADQFGFYNYTEYVAEKKRVDYALLAQRLREFLAGTEQKYAELMGPWVEERTGHRLGELGSNHFAYVSRMPQYDEFFSKQKLISVYERTLAGLGLDLSAQANILIDIEDRPKKNPRAVCYPAKPPTEVHLIIKPIGGLDDYASFFHEAGHAQHYGNVDPSLPYVDRAIGTSYALSEIYSFLMQFLTVNVSWLRDVAGVPEETAREVVYYTKLAEFYMLRRYAAKLQYELEFFEAPLMDDRNRVLYARTLGDATQFLYQQGNFLNDMDGGYYTADYLRAWITEAMLRHHLEEEYGEAWYANPKAGELLRGLWAMGEQKENEDVARLIGYEPFDATYLAEQFLSLSPVRPG